MPAIKPIKPIKLWGRGGPNPPKVTILLEELQVPYEIDSMTISDVKKPAYLAVNPNGRVPAIHDPNTNLTLWESGAIVEYLIETYDPEHKLSFQPGTPESYHAKQYLFFQVSGQAPYYGQLAFFMKFATEKIPLAIERYKNEINRVTGVLEAVLTQQEELHPGGDGPWLVGNKYSYADLSFMTWQRSVGVYLNEDNIFDLSAHPHVQTWLKKMLERPASKAGLARMDA